MSDKQKSDEENKPSSSSDEKGLKVRVKKALARFFVRRPEKKELEERNILAPPADRQLRAKQLELRLSTRVSKETLEQLNILQPEPEPEPEPESKPRGVKRVVARVNRKASQLRERVLKGRKKDQLHSQDDADLPKKEVSSPRNLDAQSRRAKFKRKSRSMPAVIRSRKNNAHVFGGRLPDMDMKNVACEGQLVTVPLLVTVCVDYLLPKIELEGLFRVSGNHTDIARIKRQIDKTRQYDVLAQCDNPNTVAGVFKSFFRELAEPLLTFAHYALFIAAVTPDKHNPAPNDEETRVKRAEQLRALLPRLPRPNYELLLYLVSFLVKVSQASKLNLMDSRNLSLIFGSIVLRDEHEDMTSVTALTNTSVQAAVMAVLIDHFDLIFKRAPVTPVKSGTPPSSVTDTLSPPVNTMTSTVTPVNATLAPTVNMSATLPQTFSSPAMLTRPAAQPVAPVNAMTSTVTPKTAGPGPLNPRGPAPPPRGKTGTAKTGVKSSVKFSSAEVQSNTNVPPVPTRPKIALVAPEPRAVAAEPKSEPAPKNSPPKTSIPVLGTPYPVSVEKRGTVPGDGTHEEPKSEPIRVRAITAGHADKEAHVKVATAPPRADVSATQPRADVSATQPRAPVTPVTAPNHGPVKRPAVPVTPVTLPSANAPKLPKEAGPVSAPLLSPPSTAPKKSPIPTVSPKTPGVQKVAPPTPPPRGAKTPVATSPKEPRRSYSLQTLN